jgi:hypothetical protein
MAKKKTARPSRGAKKKAAPKKAAPKKKTAPKKKKTARVATSARKPAAASYYETGLEDPTCVNFKPLKAQIAAFVARLDSTKNVTPEIQNAVKALRQVQADLNAECTPTMVIPV